MTIITISIDDKTLSQYNKRAYKDYKSDRSKLLAKFIWTGTVLEAEIYNIIALKALEQNKTVDQIVNDLLKDMLNGG